MATMKSKPVAFNLENEQEKRLYEFCERNIPKGQFGSFIKRLIATEYQKRIANQRK